MLSFFLPGRNRKLHHTLRLTALVLMISLMCPTVSALAASADAANPTDQTAEQASEFINTLQVLFIHGYKTLWQSQGCGAQLTEIIEKTVDEQYGGFLDRFKSLNESAIEPVQKSIEEKFNPLYDEFLSKLQDRFNEDFARQITTYFKTRIAELIIRVDDSKKRSDILDRGKDLLANNGIELKKRVRAGLTSGAKKSDKSRGAVSKWAYFLAPLTMGINLAKALHDVWNAPEKLKGSLESVYGTFFYEKAPEELWLTTEESVRDGFREVDNELQEIIRQVEEPAASEIVK